MTGIADILTRGIAPWALLPRAPMMGFVPTLAGSWLAGWTYRVALTVDGTVPGLSASVVGEARVGIPVTLKAICQASGQDLRITSSDGTTLLPHAIEDWSAANPIVHIRGTFGVGDTVLYAYGSNATASDVQSKPNVSQDHELYLPMGDAGPTTAADWTVNASDATQTGGVTFGATGRVGDGVSLDGTDDGLNAGTPATLEDLGDLTLEMWLTLNGECDDWGTYYGTLIDKSGGPAAAESGWSLYLTRASGETDYAVNFWRPLVTTNCLLTVTEQIAIGSTYHIAATYDDATKTCEIFVDGASVGTATGAGAIVTDATVVAADVSSSFLNATLDQMSIASAVRSDDQIAFDAFSYPGSTLFAWSVALAMPPSVPGLEAALRDTRPRARLADTRLHARLADTRLHARLPVEN